MSCTQASGVTGDPRGNPNAEKQKRNRTPSSVCKRSSTRCKVISQTYNASFTYIYTIKVCDPKIQMKKIKNKIHKLWHVYILSVVNMYFTHLSGFVTYPIVSTEQNHLRTENRGWSLVNGHLVFTEVEEMYLRTNKPLC